VLSFYFCIFRQRTPRARHSIMWTSRSLYVGFNKDIVHSPKTPSSLYQKRSPTPLYIINPHSTHYGAKHKNRNTKSLVVKKGKEHTIF
jgi:hypothetical protein